ncbi:alpha/beta hydrolase, partial [Vibrio vulnificus]
IKEVILSINQDFYIKHVENSDDAMQQMLKRSYAFVILDIQIPNTAIDKAKNPEGGVELLRWIKHKQKRKKITPPKNIIVLTEYSQLRDKYNEENQGYRVFTYLYSPSDITWKAKLIEYVEEYQLTTYDKTLPNSDSKVVFSVHGINTHGEWQKEFDKYIKKNRKEYTHLLYDYQYFPVTSFLYPPRRKVEVERLIREFRLIARKYPNAKVQLVGHSFGTYLIAEALKKIPNEHSPNFDKVVLNGSVLKSGYNWSEIVTKHGITKIVNNCALNDKALLASQLLAIGLGMGGREGFKGSLTDIMINRFYKGGHSVCLSTEQFNQWFELFEHSNVLKVDKRGKVTAITTIKNTLVNLMPTIFILPIVALIFWLANK